MRWQIVIPQKPLAQAKSRLTNGPVLAEAMLRDVVTACRGLDVGLALLGGDPRLTSLEVPQLSDAGGGLSAAVRAVVPELTGPVAVLMGDLPCLSAAQLEQVLRGAEEVEFGVVADASGTGTTMLTALAGRNLETSYGAGSFARHRALGALDLLAGGPPAPGLQRDVDTIADLEQAVRLGVGSATRYAMTRLEFDAVHLGGP